MTLRRSFVFLPFFFFCLGFLNCNSGFAEQTSELRVCLLENNLPLSSRKDESGFDVDTAKAVAKTLHRTFVPVWTENSTRVIEIEESDFPLRRLVRGECDAIFSIPGEDAIKGAPKAALGAPYYGAAFELIGREKVPNSLDAVGDAPVAVQAQTIANFVLSSRKMKMRTFFSISAALAGVAKGEVPVAFLWGPMAGWHLRNHPELDLEMAPEYKPQPVVSWNEHVVTQKNDTSLREAIDAALENLRAGGTLKTLMGKYGVPFHPPFASTYSIAEMQKLK